LYLKKKNQGANIMAKIKPAEIQIENNLTRENNGYAYSEISVKVPDHDSDVAIVFPNGKKLLIQCRPSNAEVNYNGSLDIILPYDNIVTCWRGDDMEAAPAVENRQYERRAKQLVTELP